MSEVAQPPVIRNERPADRDAVFRVHARAFDGEAEARLVDALRERGKIIVSLVAEQGGEIVGNVVFSPMTMASVSARVAGLAPVAVVPESQNRGIGGELIRQGLVACRQAGYGAAVVLGHPGYYPRFGFVPAKEFGVRCEYAAAEEAFMAIELHPDGLRGCGGVARYDPAFASVE